MTISGQLQCDCHYGCRDAKTGQCGACNFTGEVWVWVGCYRPGTPSEQHYRPQTLCQTHSTSGRHFSCTGTLGNCGGGVGEWCVYFQHRCGGLCPLEQWEAVPWRGGDSIDMGVIPMRYMEREKMEVPGRCPAMWYG